MTAAARIGVFGDGPTEVFQSLSGRADTVTVPGGDWLLHAKFSHMGPDLLLTGEDGVQLLVRDYFAQMNLPDLVTDHGAVIGGDLAARLAGPLVPGQYAQAGDAPTAASVGNVSKLSGEANVRHADGTSAPLKQGDQIFKGDVVQTGATGQLGITFDDGAVFSLGQRGRMTVDEMTWDPATAKGTETLSVVSGPFSFVSGEIAKTGVDAMSIKTPVATIGVRGTTGAGFAAPEGQPNRITLMPNADGSVGELAVTNQAGVQVMSVPGATTQLASAFIAPPPPVILTPQQIQQQYGGALQVLPPPPTPQQIQQNLQQKGSQAPTDKAVQAAKATAAEKGAAEKATAEKAAAAEKALGEKLGAEKAEMAKMAAEKGLAEGIKLAEAKIGDALGQVLGLTQGQFGEIGAKIGDVFAKAVGPLGPLGPLDPGAAFGPLGPGGFNLEKLINDIGGIIQTGVNQVIEKQIGRLFEAAKDNPTTQHTLTAGSQNITLTNGVNDQIIGSSSNNVVTVTGYFGNNNSDLDSFTDTNTGDSDSLTINVGAGTNNTFGVTNVELVDLSGSATLDAGAGIKNVDIGSDGTTTIYASLGADSLTGTPISTYAPTGDQNWHILGHLGVAGADSINMAGGNDALFLDTTGTHVINAISNVESLLLKDGAANTVSFQAPITGITVTGGNNTDTLNLANLANALTISGVESVVGGSGTDALTLSPGGQSVTVSGIETITGGSGTDVVTMGTAGTIGVSSVEVMTGSSGVDTISYSGPSTGNTSTLIGGGGSDTLSTTSNGGSIIFRYEAAGDFGDTVTNFQAGGTTDALNFLVSGFTGADKLLTTGDGSTAVTATSAGATISFQTVSATGNFTATTGNEVFIFSHASFSSASALQTAINTGGGTVITFGNAGITNGGRFLAAYDNGTNTHIATITIGNVTDSAAATVADVATLNNVSDVTTLTTADFNCV